MNVLKQWIACYKGVPLLFALNSILIATAYLLTLKRAGREYAWTAMEATSHDIRQFLEDAFTMASHHAYDIAMDGQERLLPSGASSPKRNPNDRRNVQYGSATSESDDVIC